MKNEEDELVVNQEDASQEEETKGQDESQQVNQGNHVQASTDESEDSDDENETRLKSVKNFQSNQDSNTFLMPRDMSDDVVMNTRSSAIKKSPGEGKKSITIAPGNL